MGEAPRILSPLITDQWGGLRPMRSDTRELGRSDHHRFKAVRTFKRGDQEFNIAEISWAEAQLV